MKYAFMSFSCPQLSLQRMLEVAAELGYDGVEPRITAGHAHGLEPDSPQNVRREAKERARTCGIALACIATSCTFADPATRGQQIDGLKQAVDLAADVGAPVVRVFGGGIPKGMSREDAIVQVGDALLAGADHAARRGVTIAMETHDDWCDPDHVAAVMTHADHEAVRVNWDIMHPVRCGLATMEQAFDTLEPWIAHVHFHDGQTDGGALNLVPVGQGNIDHRAAIRCLASMSFDGFLSGEWINWEPWDMHLPRELETMKTYEQQLSAD